MPLSAFRPQAHPAYSHSLGDKPFQACHTSPFVRSNPVLRPGSCLKQRPSFPSLCFQRPVWRSPFYRPPPLFLLASTAFPQRRVNRLYHIFLLSVNYAARDLSLFFGENSQLTAGNNTTIRNHRGKPHRTAYTSAFFIKTLSINN